MKSDIAVTTTSWIRTESESKVVLPAIKELSKLGLPVIIVDAGSSLGYQKQIKKMDNIIFSENRNGLASQIIQSHQEAVKHADYLFYLQSDKLEFVKNTVPKMIARYRNFANKGIFIPARTKESIDTYPNYQKVQEEFLNFMMSDYIGIKQDYYAGPKIYPASLVKYLKFIKGDIGWGVEAYFYVIVKKLGLSFEFTDFYMKAPVDIDDEE